MNCLRCSKEFHSRQPNAIYCSEKCRKRASEKRRKKKYPEKYRKNGLEYYYRNKSVVLDRQKENRTSINTRAREKAMAATEYLKSIKISKGCQLCGYNKCSEALDFHHVKEKEFALSRKAGSVSHERLKREMDKCIVVCANCHREIHAGQTGILSFNHGEVREVIKECDEPPLLRLISSNG